MNLNIRKAIAKVVQFALAYVFVMYIIPNYGFEIASFLTGIS